MKRNRQRFLKLMMQDDFALALESFPGDYVSERIPGRGYRVDLRPNRSKLAFIGYGATAMIALRDAAWGWLEHLRYPT